MPYITVEIQYSMPKTKIPKIPEIPKTTPIQLYRCLGEEGHHHILPHEQQPVGMVTAGHSGSEAQAAFQQVLEAWI